ncbi:lactose permease [Colletotrichum truncatum]|uniref:Lactose permease n=1 Tax=Colletotrichum truncatum TaxID=5467 RepID=A0ACC3YYU1_COLTU|nr:lactose permease [Colletotrichum truncatum]KAF6781757.1 lactose permease [Colletotrichum truncatum]
MAASKKNGAAAAVGFSLAKVLPDDSRPWYRVPHLLRLNLCLLVPLMSSCSIGYDGSMMNGLQTLPQWKKHFDNPTGAMLGAMNAVYPAGKIVALFIVAYLNDSYGRKKCIALGAFLCVLLPLMQGFSTSAAMFIASRALIGFVTSFMSLPSPILVSELAYPTQRGKLTALYNTSFYLGGIIAAWCTFGTFKLESNWSWRIPSILQGAMPLVQFIGVFFLPESPRWLVANGRRNDARAILVKYHAGGDENSPLVDFELVEIEAALTAEADVMSQHSWLDLFRTPANRKRLLITFIVGWFAQWNGVGMISYYLGLILNTIGITEGKDQTLINALLNVANWIAAVGIGALMVDRLGRRTLWLMSTGTMFICYIIWTSLTAKFIETKDAGLGKAVVAFVFLTNLGYAFAWSPLLQAYIVEIWPYSLRSRGVSALYITSFSALVFANQVNPIAMAAIAWKYYILFCCILFFLLITIWFVFPETKGFSLEEISQIFGDGVPHVDVEKVEDVKEDAEVAQVEIKKG